MPIYTFTETATIRTTIEAESEDDAWDKIDLIELKLPNCMQLDVHSVEVEEVIQ